MTTKGPGNALTLLLLIVRCLQCMYVAFSKAHSYHLLSLFHLLVIDATSCHRKRQALVTITLISIMIVLIAKIQVDLTIRNMFTVKLHCMSDKHVLSKLLNTQLTLVVNKECNSVCIPMVGQLLFTSESNSKVSMPCK